MADDDVQDAQKGTDEGASPEGQQGSEGRPDGQQDAAEGTPEGEEAPLRKARKEAAGYRERLRTTEEERDRLATVVESYRRTDAETAAGKVLRSGADLWAGGVQLADLLDEDGRIDPAKVTEAAQRLAADRPHWRQTFPDLGQGKRGAPPVESGSGFGAMLREARDRSRA